MTKFRNRKIKRAYAGINKIGLNSGLARFRYYLAKSKNRLLKLNRRENERLTDGQ